jgi:hypothetical protein
MSTIKTKAENITLLPYNERVKLVRERLANLRRPQVTSLTKPAKVLAAEKTLNDWLVKNEAHEDAQRQAHRKKLHEVQDALIVGDMAKAVQLMQQLGA